MPGSSQNPSGSSSPGAAPAEGDAPVLVDLVLRDADWIVPCDARMRRVERGSIAVESGRVAAVGEAHEMARRFRGRREVDARGLLLLPGLVNAHTHAAMSCFRGLGDDLPLRRWLFEVIFPAESAFVTPELVYHGTRLSCAEMLLGGVTTFCDGYFHEEEAARAAVESGARAILGQGVLDFPAPDNPDPARARERVETFLAAFPTGCDRVRPSLFCHAPYTCGPQTLEWVKALCRERGMLFQIHLSETAREVEDLTACYGLRPAFHLDRLGLLDDLTLCAHGIWLDQAEITLLAERGAGIAHCPESNMKLASGVAPIPELILAGVRVGLGTDGPASNNDLDLFSEMGRAARLEKVMKLDPTAAPAAGTLHMATAGGATVLGWGDEIGSLEAGKRADIVAIDLARPHLVPLYDPVSHLVHAAGPGDVKHVWVNGEQVVRDGRLTTMDVRETMEAVRRLARKIR